MVHQLLVDACACEATDDDSDLCQDAEAVADSDDDAACRSYYYASVPAECQTADDGDSGSEDEDAPYDGDDDDPNVVPDGVTGMYNNVMTGATGCGGDTHWIEEMLPGPMTVDVDSERLRFVVSGDLSLSGGVDGRSYTVTGMWAVASDDDDVGGAELDVSVSGDLDKGSDGCWTIHGDVEMVVDQDGLEATNCALVGTMRASQLEGADCNGTL